MTPDSVETKCGLSVGTQGGLSIRAYARHRGVTHGAVLKAIETGRIVKLKNGRINAKDADARWEASTDPSKPKGTRSRGRHAGDVAETAQPTTFAASRAEHETYLARSARLRYQRLEGTLLPMEDVRRAFFATGRKVRDAFVALREPLASRIAPISDPHDCLAVLTEEFDRVLLELASAPPELILAGAASDGDSSTRA